MDQNLAFIFDYLTGWVEADPNNRQFTYSCFGDWRKGLQIRASDMAGIGHHVQFQACEIVKETDLYAKVARIADLRAACERKPGLAPLIAVGEVVRFIYAQPGNDVLSAEVVATDEDSVSARDPASGIVTKLTRGKYAPIFTEKHPNQAPIGLWWFLSIDNPSAATEGRTSDAEKARPIG